MQSSKLLLVASLKGVRLINFQLLVSMAGIHSSNAISLDDARTMIGRDVNKEIVKYGCASDLYYSGPFHLG